jgi:hypothetical protein
MISVALLYHAADAARPRFGESHVLLCGKPALPSSAVCGFTLLHQNSEGPQVAMMGAQGTFVASLRRGEDVAVAVPVRGISGRVSVTARATLVYGEGAEISLSVGEVEKRHILSREETAELEVLGETRAREATLHLKTSARSGGAAVRWDSLSLVAGDRSYDIPLLLDARDPWICPAPVLPTLQPAIEQALIEWDWRMQDGIGTPREPSSYVEATERTLRRGDALIRQLRSHGVPLDNESTRWQALWSEWKELSAADDTDQPAWEDLWRRVHTLRRQIVFRNPLANVGPLLFVKQVPGIFSHQLTQYCGRYARPGGGVFVLDEPGRSMRCRELTAGKLPIGSYQHPEVSYDGERVLFAFCEVSRTPEHWQEAQHAKRYYHLYEMHADGSNLRRLTDGPFDDFAPRYLPDGRMIFISARGFGFSRCGPDVASAHKLTVAGSDGSNLLLISFHETHEWDPAVLNDGRVIYTRWDYVDRNAAYYQHLWSVRPDGSNARIFYGNNTFNPMGTWEARPVPGSNRVIATAAAHHAMTAGSIVLVDVTRGVDGLDPIKRLTPDALFPESETEVEPGWYSPIGFSEPPPLPVEAERWPGHCYKSPYPLSEDFFLAAYSYDSLIGEEEANLPNMFGIFLMDRFGNKELLYRDLNIGSLYPVPLRPRLQPPAVPTISELAGGQEGTFFLQDVYEAQPPLPKGAIKRLRIVQVLPKSTPIESDPPVGIPNAAPGKNVLGTVPVEEDGSAYFRAPAGVPLQFQALDDRGRAVQIMRSIVYLQPGETVSCIGCHEDRMTAPTSRQLSRALARPPSTIHPGPDGSNPLCYPILVQPVLDKHCVNCHGEDRPEGGVALIGESEEHFTVSYNALVPLVSYSAWAHGGDDWLRVNSEPVTMPGHLGARGSELMRLLEEHHEVQLNAEDLERLVTWMDANALFYGTFDHADQARQRRGERIEGS